MVAVPPPKGVVIQRDKLGRLYKTINGHREKVGEGAAARKAAKRKRERGEKHHPHTHAASAMLRELFESVKKPEDIRKRVDELLADERFWKWFTDPQSPPDARLYVAKVLLGKVRDAANARVE